jgi:hypothetical protein
MSVGSAMLFLLLALLVLVTKYAGWPVERRTIPVVGEVPGITGVSRAALIVVLALFSIASGVIGIGCLVLQGLDATARRAGEAP